MTIRAIAGRTGSGKSYKAVQLMNDAYLSGKHIVTNIPHNFTGDNIHLWDWKHLRPDAEPLPYPMGAVYFLDEAWRMEISKIKARQNEVLLSFFKEHRHRTDENGLSDEIYLCSQSVGDLPPVIAELIEETIICVKPTNLGMKGKSFRYYHEGAIKGVSPVSSKIIRNEIETLKPEIFALYKTATLGDGEGGFDKEGLTGGSTVFQSWKFKMYLVIGVITISTFFWGLYKINTKIIPKYTGKAPQTNAVPVQPITNQPSSVPMVVQPPQPTPQLQPQPQPEKPKQLVESERWRVSGFISTRTKQAILLADKRSHIKQVPVSDCKIDNFKQVTCQQDGEIITAYSGSYNAAISESFNTAIK